MHPRTRTTNRVRRALLAALLAAAAASASAQAPDAAAAATPPVSPPPLKDLFDAAWSRQPEARALQARRDAVQARRRAADAWTPEPPAFEARHQTDRLTRNDGARELEVGMAVPLWLPGERQGSAALADAEAVAAESRAGAARLRVAAAVRDAWWAWQRAGVELELARGQLDSARRIAADVARRAQAGDMARADQHQAEGAAAAAEAAVALAEASLAAAHRQIEVLSGIAPPRPATAPASEPEPTGTDSAVHPVLAELQDRWDVAERAAALAATQSRAHPELTLATTRDRGASGERYGQTVTLALRIPFGDGPRHDGRVASARADALEAQAQLELDRMRLQAERDAARARVGAARTQRAAAERRAALARETRGFFEKSFRLGETDLPTRLRIEAEAAEAERQAARSRIELAAAVSAWRQALGLLPQ
ncbi:TolC family protein [Piscinibacter sakaiensis]|uniref:Heavy metal RND efflux outer membrane protein, CzcC family n=1 Tax=Piscinibacter sakaiensis TaxID=1547922 RepID=A0A0K8P805_PISS1|nr:TolC family protein [Piscinibacter sakaiensis]GAP38766.1 heavy metal RND efflux outer membrane protein, CzcC family [Piscinibacter sakaiensis]